MVDLVAQTIKTTGMLLNLAWPHYKEVYPSETSYASCLKEGDPPEASSTDAV